MGRVRVFIACSLDGFIAADDNDLSWLPVPGEGDDDAGYAAFMADIGAVLVGRTTFDVVAAMGLPESPWGDRPALVLSHRPLPQTAWPTARLVAGHIVDVVATAKKAAGDKDVYVDGGAVIREVLDEGLLDEVTVTIVPAILGRGTPLFAGVTRRWALTLIDERRAHSGLVQLRYAVTTTREVPDGAA
jgi:dihydrofolate reductase